MISFATRRGTGFALPSWHWPGFQNGWDEVYPDDATVYTRPDQEKQRRSIDWFFVHTVLAVASAFALIVPNVGVCTAAIFSVAVNAWAAVDQA